ncbi:hypothetical protein [Roseibium aggregatum]|uniref:hypothetical protein n=1 Tax=Roseibium aggregatum TaxID=187304 RepID=UPI0018DCBB21|nr:hypothetical protein [Roseibium aggregatum]
MKSRRSALTPRMIAAYCEKRLQPFFSSHEVESLQRHLMALLERCEYPTYKGSRLDIHALADDLGLDAHRLATERSNLQPIFDAVSRSIADTSMHPDTMGRRASRPQEARPDEQVPERSSERLPEDRKRRGKQHRPVVEFPDPLQSKWDQPSDFGAALRLHSKRHGESIYHLYNAVVGNDDGIKRSTFLGWGRRKTAPAAPICLDILGRIERRYRLPAGYFSSVPAVAGRSSGSCELDDMTAAERRRLVWHLPDDFRRRSKTEKRPRLSPGFATSS